MGEKLALQGTGAGKGIAIRLRRVGKERIGRFNGNRYAVAKTERTGDTDSSRFTLPPVS